MRTVLHIEDDASLQRLVRIALEQAGSYAVQTAGDGEQALELARASAPSLVLLDLHLPGMSGMAVLQAMRELPALREVPVVFLTAATDPKLLGELHSLGVTEVLIKPFRPRLLVQTIDRVLGGSQDGS